ncbi:MAG: amidohydrolase family protein [Phycisphaerales bacterium]|nr:MAG: amidohydrolase family protein [Phycisphaerales bacterium]
MKSVRRFKRVCVCLLAVIVGGFVPRIARAEFKTPIAITNLTVVVEPGSTIESGTIVIDEGRIVSAGTEVDIPPQAEQIDGIGLIAYPGFIDAHVHLGIPEKVRTAEERERTEDVNPDPSQGPLAATRFANRRGIRPQLGAVELYVPDDKALEAHRAAGFTAALVAPRDGILSGTSNLLSISDRPVRRSVLMSDVAMHGSFEAGEEGQYPRSLLGVFAQFRQVMLDARWYAKIGKYQERHPTTGARPPTDPALEALQPLLSRKQLIIFEANTENEIRRALNLTGEFNLNVGISGGKEAWKVIDRIKAEHIPLIVSLKFDREPEYGKKNGKTNEEHKKIYEPLKARKERRRLWEEQVANIIRLHEAGIPFALRTRDFEKPSEFWKNLRMVIERGLPEEAAIAALTATPAELLGMKDQLGAIRRGRIANLTLMTKSISDEKAKVKFVFVDGKKFEIELDKKDKEAEKDKPDKHEESDQGGPPPIEKEEVTDKDEDTGPTWAVEIKADRIPETQTGGNVLIRNTTIIPVSSPRLDDASILIRNGKIEAIGDIPTVPDGVTVIDGTGRFVIPGLVDCHSHLALQGANESAVAISAEVRVTDVINPHSVGIYRAVAGGTTTHHALHGSANPIGGRNAIMKLKYGRPASEMLLADAPPTIKFALGENVTQSGWQQERGKRFPSSRMGVEALMRTALEEGKAYAEKWEDYERRSQAGQDVPLPRRDLRLEALAKVVAGDLIVHPHCYRSDEILHLLTLAEEYGFRIGTLQHVLEGYRIAPEIARHGCGASTFANLWGYKIEAFGAIPHNAALMTEHGISVSLNSDSPSRMRYFGQEAAKCIKWGGLSENEPLRMVTLNPARQLQIDDRVGSLEVGKDGDLAIFNGHPLNTFSKCVMTLIEGEVYFEDPRPKPTEPCDTPNLPGQVDRTIPETLHRAYAVVGATVHPISGPVIRNGTVVILEDKIHDIGVDVTVPPGAGVIDGTGLHVYPGLIDAGSGLGVVEIWSLRVTRDYSDIATFAPHLRTASAIHPHSEHIHIARTAGITAALTQPSGEGIPGQSAVIHLDGWTVPEMLMVDEYGLHMTVPSLPARLPEDKKEKEKLAKEHKKDMREIEEFIKKAKHYAEVKKLAATDSQIKYDIDLTLEAMVPYVRGEKPVVFSAHRYKQVLDTIEFAEKYGLRCVLSGATRAWKLADVLAEKDIPVILAGPLSYPRGEFEPWDSIYRCAGELDRAGVRFCFASENAAGAFNLPIQAGMAVAHGLPRQRAEYALTLGAAEILGIADRVGSIEVGKQADLIVTTDTPLQTVSQVTHMFIAGKPIELASMHTETYKKFKKRSTPKLPPPPTLVGPPSLTKR